MSNALQLNLFSPVEPIWENITNEWLCEYLQTNYPDIGFKYDKEYGWGDEWIIICSTSSKRAKVSFHISNDAELSIWNSTVIAHCDIQQNYGNYCGMGEAVDNMQDLKDRIEHYIKCYRDDITTNYIKYKNRKTDND